MATKKAPAKENQKGKRASAKSKKLTEAVTPDNPQAPIASQESTNPVISAPENEQPPLQSPAIDQDTKSAAQSETPLASAPEVGEQMRSAAIAIVGDDAKITPALTTKAKYQGAIVAVDQHTALQRINQSDSFVAHPLQEGLQLDVDATKSVRITYEKGNVSVENVQSVSQSSIKEPPSVEQDLANKARALSGEKARFYDAQLDGGLYKGAIVGVSAGVAMQRVGQSDTYIIHQVERLPPQIAALETLGVGTAPVGVAYAKDGKASVYQLEPVVQQGASIQGAQPEHDQKKYTESKSVCRAFVKKDHGQDVQLFDAKTQKNNYSGTIATITSHHVAQRVSAKSFVLHDRANLQGEYHKGSDVTIAYSNGRAVSALRGQQQNAQPGHTPEQQPMRGDPVSPGKAQALDAFNHAMADVTSGGKMYDAKTSAAVYDGPVIHATPTHTLQQVRDTTSFVIHDNTALSKEAMQTLRKAAMQGVDAQLPGSTPVTFAYDQGSLKVSHHEGPYKAYRSAAPADKATPTPVKARQAGMSR